MLNNDVFYYSTLKKYIYLFGSMFNNMVINRYDKNGNVTQIINVPIQYAEKEKMLTRVISDPDIDRKDAIILPAISFEIKDIVYDSERKFNTDGQYGFNLTNTSIGFYKNPVPYDVHFSLFIYVKNREDGNKIVEQILPFFTPDFTFRAILFPNMPSIDVPVILDGAQIVDQSNEDFKTRDITMWNLGFTLKGCFYGPQRTSPVINLANVTVSVWTGNNSPDLFEEFGLEEISNSNYVVTSNDSIVINSASDSIRYISAGNLSISNT